MEGWVTTKKGRWDLPEYGKGLGEPAIALQIDANAALNLNVLPVRHVQTGTTWTALSAATPDCNAGGNRKGGNGMGRGSGRGRGLPAVQPRFHTPVRYAPFTDVFMSAYML